ncbi:MAG: endonuclease MutS2 [Eubacteriales bacterium]|nr:endonuclease MutS2 [Eubacteriales bacterium]
MNKKIEKTLEYDKVKNIISEYANSFDAKEMINNLRPIKSATEIEKLHTENEATLDMIRIKGIPQFFGTKNIDIILKKLEIKSTLSIREILDVLDVLIVSNRIIEYFYNDEHLNKEIVSLNIIKEYFTSIKPMKNTVEEIRKIIISEDEISDNASPTLKDIRKKRHILEEKIHSTMNKLLNSYKDYLQEPIIVQKNNTYCLPIKAENKNKIQGTVQDQSASSFTLFIEPLEIIQINSDIKKNILDEQIEINRLLKYLSEELSFHIDELSTNIKNLIYLDFLFAKAKYHLEMKCTKPIINDDNYINLKDARHPLIDKEKIVPIDISLGKNYSSLIITGPNTGGKTVCLKTVGLIELMGLSGIFIPTFDNSSIAIFDEIFADIGDEQSIEQSLSTFSSHMKNIIYILKYANEKSLSLFDELCTGTDPTEGASLAISILEEMKNRNSTLIATTHYPEIKMYALSRDGIENGSFEFDINNLCPTYKLLIGLPGKSNAFLISEKLGLDKSIIEKAKMKLSNQDIKFEDVVASLQESKKTIEQEREEIEKYKAEISLLKEKVLRQKKGLEDRENSIIKKAKEKAIEILNNANEISEKSIKNIKQYEEDITKLRNEKSNINQNLNSLQESLILDEKKKLKGPSLPISPKKIKIGDKVHILSLDIDGIVDTLPDKNYNLFVQCGNLRTKTFVKDLEYLKESDKKDNQSKQKNSYKNTASSKINKDASINNKSLNISPQINVIGLNTDDALFEVEKYIDDAYLSNLMQVRIIHGRGTGALKNAIANYLRKLKIISSFRPGDSFEGGDGVTVVLFK